MIGSNSTRKNTQMVAKLFASEPELHDVMLVIVGGKYVNLGAVDDIVAENLIYTDYIKDGELRSLYSHAQALIFHLSMKDLGFRCSKQWQSQLS